MAFWRRFFRRKTTAEEKADWVSSKAAPEKSAITCAICGRVVSDFHYVFEHILLALPVGCQCANCGKVVCDEHSSVYAKIDSCSDCGGRIVWLLEGPASSSMVEEARIQGQYGAHIRDPYRSGRKVEHR